MTGHLCSSSKGAAPAGQRPYLPIPNSDRHPASGKMDHSRWTEPGGFIGLGWAWWDGPGDSTCKRNPQPGPVEQIYSLHPGLLAWSLRILP